MVLLPQDSRIVDIAETDLPDTYVVLAEWQNKYVTWIANSLGVVWGHYFGTIDEARKDFADRLNQYLERMIEDC